jgi:hypothetical protein
MPSLVGAITTLGLIGGTPTAAPVFDPDYAAPPTFPRPYTETWTALGLGGTPSKRAISFVKEEASLAEVTASDTWLVAWTEAPIEGQEIATTDSWRISWTETATLTRAVAVADSWTVNWSESIALSQGGVTEKSGTDTWSVSFTEAVALSVTIAATDTWTVDWSESAALSTTVEAIDATDTWTVSWSEESLLGIFVGEVPIGATDTWNVSWTEAGRALPQGRIRRIVFKPIKPRMTFKKL